MQTGLSCSLVCYTHLEELQACSMHCKQKYPHTHIQHSNAYILPRNITVLFITQTSLAALIRKLNAFAYEHTNKNITIATVMAYWNTETVHKWNRQPYNITQEFLKWWSKILYIFSASNKGCKFIQVWLSPHWFGISVFDISLISKAKKTVSKAQSMGATTLDLCWHLYVPP